MDMKMFSYKLFGTKLKISFQIKLAYRTAERERKKKSKCIVSQATSTGAWVKNKIETIVCYKASLTF